MVRGKNRRSRDSTLWSYRQTDIFHVFLFDNPLLAIMAAIRHQQSWTIQSTTVDTNDGKQNSLNSLSWRFGYQLACRLRS